MNAVLAALLAVVLLAIQANASHFRYGTASYTRQGFDVTFTVTSGWRYYTLTPDGVAGGYINLLTLELFVLDGTRITAPTRAVIGDYGQPIPDGTGEEYGLRTDRYNPVRLSDGVFKYWLADCCRIRSLENAANNPEQLWGSIDLRGGAQGSPQVNTAPIWLPPIGGVRILDLNPVDQSGGQTYCTFTQYDGGCDLNSTEWTTPGDRCAQLTSGIRLPATVPTIGGPPSQVYLTGPGNCQVAWNLTRADPSWINKKWAISVYVNSTTTAASVPVDWIVILRNSLVPRCSTAQQKWVFNLESDSLIIFNEEIARVDAPIPSFPDVLPAGYALQFETVQGAPPGAQFQPGTGFTTTNPSLGVRMVLQPNNNNAGSYSMNVIFSDSLGGSCSVSVTLQILAPLVLEVTNPNGGVVNNSVLSTMGNVLLGYPSPQPPPTVTYFAMVQVPTSVSTSAAYQTTMQDVLVGADRVRDNILFGLTANGQGTKFVPAAGIPCGSKLQTKVAGNVVATFTCEGNANLGWFPVSDLCCPPPPEPIYLNVKLTTVTTYEDQKAAMFVFNVGSTLEPTGIPAPTTSSNPNMPNSPTQVNVQSAYLSADPSQVQAGILALDTSLMLNAASPIIAFSQVPCGSKIEVFAGSVLANTYACRSDNGAKALSVLCCSPPPSPSPPVRTNFKLYVNISSATPMPGTAFYVAGIVQTVILPGIFVGSPPPTSDPTAGFPQTDVSVSTTTTYTSGIFDEPVAGISLLNQGALDVSANNLFKRLQVPCGAIVRTGIDAAVYRVYSCDGSVTAPGATSTASNMLCCSPPPAPLALFLNVDSPSGSVLNPALITTTTNAVLSASPPGSGVIPLVAGNPSLPPTSTTTSTKATYTTGLESDLLHGVNILYADITAPNGFPVDANVPCGSTITLVSGTPVFTFSCTGARPASGAGVQVLALCCSPPPSPPPAPSPPVALAVFVDVISPAGIANVDQIITRNGAYMSSAPGLTQAPVTTEVLPRIPFEAHSKSNFGSGNPADVTASITLLDTVITSGAYVSALAIQCGTSISIKRGSAESFFYTCLGASSPLGGQAKSVASLCCSPPPPVALDLSVKIESPISPLPVTVSMVTLAYISTLASATPAPVVPPIVGNTPGYSVPSPLSLVDLTAKYTTGNPADVQNGLAAMDVSIKASSGFIQTTRTPCGSTITMSRSGAAVKIYSCSGSTGGSLGVAVPNLCCSPPPSPSPPVATPQSVFIMVESPNGGINAGQILTTTKSVISAYPDPNPTPVTQIFGSPSGSSVTIETRYTGGTTQANTGADRINLNVQTGAPGSLGFFLPRALVPCGSKMSVAVGSSVKYAYTCDGRDGSIATPYLCCSPPPALRSPPSPPSPVVCSGYFNDKLRQDDDDWTYVFGGKQTKKSTNSDGSTKKTGTNDGRRMAQEMDKYAGGGIPEAQKAEFGFWWLSPKADTKKTVQAPKQDTKKTVVNYPPVAPADCCDQCETIKGCMASSHPDGLCGFGSLEGLKNDCRSRFCPRVPAPPPANCNGFFHAGLRRNGGQSWDDVFFGTNSGRHLMTWGIFNKFGKETYTFKKTIKVKHSGLTIKKYKTKTPNGGEDPRTSCCDQCTFIQNCDTSVHPDGFCGRGSQAGLIAYCKTQFCPAVLPTCSGWKIPSAFNGRNYVGQCTVGQGSMCTTAAQCDQQKCHGKCDTTSGRCPDSACPGNNLGGNGGNCDNTYYIPKASTKKNPWDILFKSKYGRHLLEQEERLLGSTSSCGFDVDATFAFCNFKEYGSWLGDTPMSCNVNDKNQRCLGRIRCRSSASATGTVACPASVPEGADCFSDGGSSNFKWCSYGDNCPN